MSRRAPGGLRQSGEGSGKSHLSECDENDFPSWKQKPLTFSGHSFIRRETLPLSLILFILLNCAMCNLQFE